MNTTYNEKFIKLAELKKEWVRLGKEAGDFEGIKRLLTDLYPDSAHFIYELLQNAQDASKGNKVPAIVRFTLSTEGLEFEHNGEKQFDYADVKAIVSIGAGTKIDDRTSIGKFGAGFKSVFAYTSTPHVHSGDYHFKITDLVVPEIIEPVHIGKSTLFSLPFNNQPDKTPEKALIEIERELRELGSETLLFLPNISKIEYLLHDGDTLGYMERSNEGDGFTRITVDIPGKKAKDFYWLKYEKTVHIVNENGENIECSIAIAFNLEKIHLNADSINWRIEPLSPKSGNVFIYFPAIKENSGLRFYINASFASTVARDSVRDCDENKKLINALAELVVESLVDIKERGLLSMDFLAVMPNDKDVLGDYKPIQNAVVNAFKTENLFPTKSGDFASSDALYRGPARVSDVIDDGDLSFLTDYNIPLWAKNPQRRDSSREDDFIKSLNIDEWGYDELIGEFSPLEDERRRKIEDWVRCKPDQWLMRLYALLFYVIDHGHGSVDNGLKLIRTTENKCVSASEAFFLPISGENLPKNLNFVKPEVFDSGKADERKNDARSFLEEQGVREYNESEKKRLRFERIAQKYVSQNTHVSEEDHMEDIVIFMSNEHEREKLKKKFIILGVDGKYHRPNEVCTPIIQELIERANLTKIYKKICIHHVYNKLQPIYCDKMLNFLSGLGGMTGLTVTEIVEGYSYRTKNYTICGIEDILLVLQEKRTRILFSKLIWNAVLECRLFGAEYEYVQLDGRYNWRRNKDIFSTIFSALTENSWIPDKEGMLYKPSDISYDMLHDDFTINAGGSNLFHALQLGKNIRVAQEQAAMQNSQKENDEKKRKEAETLLGVNQDDIDAIKKAKQEGFDLNRLVEDAVLRKKKSKYPTFPEHAVIHPECREEEIFYQYTSSTEKSYEDRVRHVRTTGSSIDPKTYLRNEYTNKNNEMVCQICQNEMPFKLRDGKYYFEAVEAFIIQNESEQNHLALCPLCASMYKELLKKDTGELNKFEKAVRNSNEKKIPIQLINEANVRFTDAHLHDLKLILDEDENIGFWGSER
jgi:hypothetical protein